MKGMISIFLALALMTSCHRQAKPPATMRLEVKPDEVRWNGQKLPSRCEALGDRLEVLIGDGKIGPGVRVDFAVDVSGEVMGEIFSAIIQSGGSEGNTLYFNISGHGPQDFQLSLPTMCCDPVPYEGACDGWGEIMKGEFRGQTFLEFDIALREGEFTTGGEYLDSDDIQPLLIDRRRLADEVTVQISIGSDDQVGKLLPLLAACQNLEMHINIGAAQREVSEQMQRRLAGLRTKPFRGRSPSICLRKLLSLPNVRSELLAPDILPNRWLMNCPDSQEAIRTLVVGHGRG